MNKAFRLTNTASFNYIYKHGTAFSSPLVVLIFVKATSTKVGISVSKKIGGSVVRNKAKRRIKEVIKTIIPNINGNYNYVVAAREGIADADFDSISASLISLFKRAGHLK